MLSLIMSFFTTNKSSIIKYLLIVSVFALSLFVVYNKGINNGKEQERNRLAVEYSKILEERLKENSERLTREFTEKLNIEKSKIEIEKKSIKNKDKAIEIIKKSKKLNSEEPIMSDKEVEEFNRLTRKIK